ncbi:MAG: glutamate--cysteine ligase [Bacteriovoracaceae bacterium]|nr:glutamate--cysteine ligase [Bacteriovoracaceae bacterium]
MEFKINTKAELEAFITSNWNDLNQCLDEEMEKLPCPIYSSVDIRESKTKFAPVDMNIYPAGFNNLCQLDLNASAEHFKKVISGFKPTPSKIALIPESHTKNLFYLDHLAYLQVTLRDAGFEVSFVSLDEELFGDTQEITLTSQSKFELKILKGFVDTDGILKAPGHIFDLGLLNNDQSDPINVDWRACKTPIHPTPLIGWYRRQKSEHFNYYSDVVKTFSEKYSVNPELIMARFKAIENVDFSTKEGLEDIASSIDELKVGLPENSKIFVKASQGTYGMGISVVSSGKEILEMNRKNRDKMNIGKNKIKFTSVVIQEGVDSILKYDDMAAEVAIYLVGGKPVGGFVRANSQKDNQENLNSRGMVFKKYCISEIKENNDFQAKEAVYSIISRLSTMAGALEIKNVMAEEK